MVHDAISPRAVRSTWRVFETPHTWTRDDVTPRRRRDAGVSRCAHLIVSVTSRMPLATVPGTSGIDGHDGRRDLPRGASRTRGAWEGNVIASSITLVDGAYVCGTVTTPASRA